jgi:uncharacterized protein YbjT (DUF2867 family)
LVDWLIALNSYLVIGASGMLGRYLVRYLLNRNAHVRVLVRPSSDVAFLADEAVQIVTGDAGDSKAISKQLSAVVCKQWNEVNDDE